MGRPKLALDARAVEEMAGKGASNREIADILGCDDKTIANRFSAILRKKRAERRITIREAQFKAAREGNSALLIWLGKQELDQRDQPIPSAAPGSAAPRIVTPDYDDRSQTPGPR